MTKYSVTGMGCAACSARVEKAVSSVPGVTTCTVNLLTNSMMVEGTATEESIVQAVVQAGYGASRVDEGTKDDVVKKTEEASKESGRRLIASIVFLAGLMYLSMFGMMFNLKGPAFLDSKGILGYTQALLSLIVLIINRRFFISGFKSVLHLSANMDTLVALGSSASFLYSLYVMFFMPGEHLYFEGAAMIVTLISIGKTLEAHAKGKTTNAINSLLDLAPKTATVLKDGKESVIPVSELKPGDIFIVHPGENIPSDAEIIEGNTSVNEAAITGESIPVDKKSPDRVTGATQNVSGFIKCRTLKVGQDTTFAQIIKLVTDSASSKAPVQKIADKVSSVFVPVVILLSLITFVLWKVFYADLEFSLLRAISVLVISCPCALGLATPVAVMVGNGVGAKKGILFKNSVSLEQTGKTKIVVLDKTGTLTKGEPVVKKIIPSDGIKEEQVLRLTASIEKQSLHPLAKAIVKKAEEAEIKLSPVSDFTEVPGKGVLGTIEGHKYECGRFEESAFIGIKKDGKLIGKILLQDEIKPDSPAAIKDLKKLGIKVVMLTGDSRETAHEVGKQLGIEEIYSQVLPKDKSDIVAKLKKEGFVMMVGDGINDAPALTQSDIGVAIGAGSDVAIDSAQVVLVKNSIKDVVSAIHLSREVKKNIMQNLFWAFIYNVLGIPLAAGVFTSFGITLNPMLCSLAMSLSSFCVVSNSLRLNRFKK
jgi:Cu2+-exporting ATPase